MSKLIRAKNSERKSKKRFVWKGYGYEELAERWNIKNPWNDKKRKSKDPDQELSDIISEYILNSMAWELSGPKFKKQQIIANDLRKFLTKLEEQESHIGCRAPLWRGLINIKDDGTLLKYAAILVPHMWS